MNAMPDSSLVLTHIITQTRQNISFLLSVNQLSSADADLILARLPAEAVNHSLPKDGILTPPLSDGGSAAPTPVPTPPHPAQKAIAEWSYNEDGKEPNDLSFKAGDVIEVVSFLSSDWWTGRLNGRQGLFPSNHVKLLPNPVDLPPTSFSPHDASATDGNDHSFPAPQSSPPKTPVPHPPRHASTMSFSSQQFPLRPRTTSADLRRSTLTHSRSSPSAISQAIPPIVYNPYAGPPTHRPDQPLFLRPGHA